MAGIYQTQYYFYIYAVISGIALAVHLIINWRQLVGWRNAKLRAWEREFRRFLVCLSLYFVSDVLWGVFAELKLPSILYADTALYFLAMAMTACAWTRYVVEYLEMGGRSRMCLLWLGRGLLVAFIATLIANHFTGCCFSVDANGEYLTAPLRHLMLAALIVFNSVGSGLTVAKLLRTKGAVRRRNIMVFVFGVAMIVAILLQFKNPFLPIYALGSLFGCCLMHVFVFEDERDEMHQKELLAHEYEMRFKAERAARQARRLFFSAVSHDIRTPLNGILGCSELLELGEASEAERRRYISSIRSSGKVLARLVDDILDLSKLESGKLELIEEPTNVPELVKEVVAACEVARERKHLAIKTDLCEMPWVSLDPQRIRQLLFNLLSNAYKFTARGTVAVRVHWQGGTLSFAVADTGEGISDENIARILQPFVQVVDRNHRDGTGLGLPICQKLVDLMGGELTIASKVGEGSTFTITLRNVKTVAAPAGREEGIWHSAHAPNRVLVVDDSAVNRAVVKAMLAKSGVADIVMACNGREALEKLKADSGFDLVFSDLWMPEMDGYELIRAIRADAALSRLPVYLLTADVDVRNQVEANGFTGILLKPISLESLQALFSCAEVAPGQPD